jgi:acyl carrier protein
MGKMADFDAAKTEILEWLSDTIQVPFEEIDLNKPLTEIGLDSLDAVHMVATIESIIGKELPEDVIQRVGCLNDMFDMMRQKIAAA